MNPRLKRQTVKNFGELKGKEDRRRDKTIKVVVRQTVFLPFFTSFRGEVKKRIGLINNDDTNKDSNSDSKCEVSQCSLILTDRITLGREKEGIFLVPASKERPGKHITLRT